MFRQFLKLATSKILSNNESQVNLTRHESNPLVRKVPEYVVTKSHKQQFFEQQCFKYCKLMKKIIPKPLMFCTENVHVRYYSKEGYPWNMFCGKHQTNTLEPPPPSAACQEDPAPIEACEEAKETANVCQEAKECPKEETQKILEECGVVDEQKPKCEVRPSECNAPCDNAESQPRKNSSGPNLQAARSCCGISSSNDSYGISYTPPKCCTREGNTSQNDKLSALRCTKFEVLNEVVEIPITKSRCNLCKDTVCQKPSNRTHLDDDCPKICGNEGDKKVKHGCNIPLQCNSSRLMQKDECQDRTLGAKRSKSCIAKQCDVSKLMNKSECGDAKIQGKRSKTCIAKSCDVSKLKSKSKKNDDCASENPCGVPGSVNKSRMQVQKFVSCRELKAKFARKRNAKCAPEDCEVAHMSLAKVNTCSSREIKKNPCGEPASSRKSQLVVKKFVGCKASKQGKDTNMKRSKSRSSPCIAKECNASKMTSSSDESCASEKGARNDRAGKVCKAKRCSPSGGGSSSAQLKNPCGNPEKKQSVTSARRKQFTGCMSMKKKKYKSKEDKSDCKEHEKRTSSCRLPKFGTPSKMNKFHTGTRRRFSVTKASNTKLKTSKSESQPHIPKNPIEMMRMRRKSAKSAVECSVPCTVSTSGSKMCLKSVPTRSIVKKAKKKKICGIKPIFKFKVKKTMLKKCKLKRKKKHIRKQPKRLYPWENIVPDSRILLDCIAAKEEEKKIAKKMIEAKKAKLAAKPSKCRKPFKIASTKKSLKKRVSIRKPPEFKPSVGTSEQSSGHNLNLSKMDELRNDLKNTYPWNIKVCHPPANKKESSQRTLPRQPSLKTLRRMARKNKNSLRKMALLARSKDECSGVKEYSTTPSNCGEVDDDDDGCKCLYCGSGVECQVCPGTCRAPKDGKVDEKNKRDILCNLCHIFHTRGSKAMKKYFKEKYKNKEYHIYTDAAFLDLMVYLEDERLPQPDSKKKKR